MKSKSLLVGLLLLFLCSTCSTNDQQKENERAVIAFQDSFIKLFQDKDVPKLVNRFTKDGSLKVPNNPILMGHEALTGNYTFVTSMENFSLQLKLISISVAKAGDMAYTLNDYEVGFDTPNGPFSEKGKSLIVYEKINGEWKIAHENLSNSSSL
ncbi:YybH family protein [Flavobacterium sp. UBA6135]|uniref:YybH family protein n=1 Tax=Flavobacterium sp. UBA6135 TaxID=1946553 RepID=UPI0025B99B8F|nr:DUF4440 domain-containing protein [Flavobacterium sp. UBA6135]